MVGSYLLSEKFLDVRIGDSNFLVFGLSELDLVEIGSHNWVCEDRRLILDVVKRGVSILIKFSFWGIFEVRFFLDIFDYFWMFMGSISSETACIVEGKKWTLEVLGGVVLMISSFCDIWGNVTFNKDIK